MSNIEVQIKPSGLKVKNLVDCLYAVVSSIKGICTKLDADGGVPLETYVANIFTAKFNGSIENSRGETVMNYITASERDFKIIRPTGVTYDALYGVLDQIIDMFHDLSAQLDTDTLTDNNFESLVYAAHAITYDDDAHNIGSLLGGNLQRVLVDYLYSFVHMIDTLTKKLDLDGTVTGTNYEALWDTANILMQVENSRGSIAGNALTKFNP